MSSTWDGMPGVCQHTQVSQLLAALVASSDDAIISKDLNGIITTWNQGAERLFGYTAEEAIGKSVTILIPPERHDEESRILERIRHGQRIDSYETMRRSKDGSWVEISLTVSPIKDAQGNIIGASKIARDITERKRIEEEIERRVIARTRQLTVVNAELKKEITERKRSEQRLAMQYAITRVLAECDTFAAAIPRLLQTIGESMEWEWGALWMVDRDTAVLRCQGIWHAPDLEAAQFDAISLETVGMPGRGLKGRVWQSAEPTWIADATRDINFTRAPIAARLGLRGAIAFPILFSGQAIGIMEYFSHIVRQPEEAQLAMLSAIGSQVGQFIERRYIEEERQKLASLVENSTDFIGIALPEGQVLFVNPAGQKMVGLDGDKHVRTTSMLDYVVEQERESFQQQVLPAVLREARWEGEMRFRHFQTGAPIPMLHHIFFIKEPEGDRPLALATISRDITGRKRAEQALALNAAQLKENERRLHLLAESILQHVWGYLPDHTLNYCNRRWLDYYSLTFQEAQSKSWDTCMHPDDVAPALKVWQEAELQHKPYEMEVRLRRFDGSYRRFLSRGVALYDERGELVQWFGTNTDIEDLKQTEEALRKAQMELAHATRVMSLGALTASIAHEVNQPLTAVVNNGNACLRWLGRETPDLEALREALQDIITNGKSAGDIIARIRAALKKAPMQVARLDINRVIMEGIELMRHEMQRHEVWLHTELAAGLPPVSGDRVQLQQVLLNLLMNGIEAMRTVTDQSRELLIQSGRTASDGVFVAVRDSGVGLDPQMLEWIFDAFFTTKPAGMGMGLSISHTIITAHGGQLWAERNPGPGATFQFILPRAGEE